MKLFKEYIIKIYISIFFIAVGMDLYIYFLLKNRPIKIVDNIFDETLEKVKNKSLEITKKLEEVVGNLIMVFNTDLKIICKHTLLYHKRKINNLDQNILKYNNKQKYIIEANTDKLKEQDYLKKYFNNDNQMFDYISKYEEEFKNINDRNFIIGYLRSMINI